MLNLQSSNRAEFARQLNERFGKNVQLPWTHGRHAIISDPLTIRDILLSSQENYNKAQSNYQRAQEPLGQGLLTNNSESWANQRKLLQPYFHQRNLTSFYPIMIDCFEQFRQHWHDKTVDWVTEMDHLMLIITGKTLFNIELAGVAEPFCQHTAVINDQISATLYRLPLWVPTASNNAYRHAIKQLRLIAKTIIDKNATLSKSQPDLLDSLRQGINNEEHLIDEVLTFLFAGHETVAMCLNWTILALSKHPTSRDRLQAEVDPLTLADLTDFSKLHYCQAVIKESMRLYPPIWMVARRTLVDSVCHDYLIPANTSLLLSLYSLHRDPDYWSNPDQFIPERFLKENKADLPDKGCYIPFGFGPKLCIAQNLALHQAPLLLALMIKHYQIDVLAPDNVELDCQMSLRPRDEMRVKITLR